MKKRILMLLLAACLLVNLLPFGVCAEEPQTAVDPNAKSGSCGDGLTWVLEDYTLTISGSGEMTDGAPWEAHKDHIEHVVLTGGVTKIGAEAFYKYDRIETVDFGDALVEIGEKAFYGCEDIDYIHLPATFRRFGAECFRDCWSLKRVYCDGGMPRFNDSCLWTGNYISVFYPTNNPWPSEYTMPLASSYGGNLGIMMGNFDQSLVEEELSGSEMVQQEETKETEPAETEEVLPEPTEAPTEAPVETQAPTEVTEEPVREVIMITAAATEPETEPVQTTAETQAPETTETLEPELPEEDPAGNSWIGLVMIVGVLTFLIAGAVLFRVLSRKGGRYRR